MAGQSVFNSQINPKHPLQVLSEAQSRAAVIAAGGLSGKLAEIHSDEQVGRGLLETPKPNTQEIRV